MDRQEWKKSPTVGGTIVVDEPMEGCGHGEAYAKTKDGSTSSLEFYGGYVIAETLSESNRDKAIACVNAVGGLNPEAVGEAIRAGKELSESKRDLRVKPNFHYDRIICEVDPMALRRFNLALAKLLVPIGVPIHTKPPGPNQDPPTTLTNLEE